MSTWKTKGKLYVRKGKPRLMTTKRHEQQRLAMQKYRALHKDEINRKQRERTQVERREILTVYGGVCKCCGASTYEFLTLDHVNGGGTEHRRQFPNNKVFYKWIRENNYPALLRILCSNCNSALGYYGYCPHQKEKDGN